MSQLPEPPEKGTITISISKERYYGLLAQSAKVLDLIDVDPSNSNGVVRKMIYLSIDMLNWQDPEPEILRRIAGERDV